MLIRFFVSNFMSFAEEVELTMFPSSYKIHKEHVYKSRMVDLLKAGAIYGANGSGKSNFVKALHFLHDIVVNGDLNETEVKHTPFRLDAAYLQKESVFGVEIKKGNNCYAYSISVKGGEIIEESLYETFPGKKDDQLIFLRKTHRGVTKVNIHESLITNEKEKLRYELYAEDLKPGQSFLFKVQDKLKKAQPVFEWFKKDLWIIYPGSKYFVALRLSFDENFKLFLNNLLPKLGTGMSQIALERIPFKDFFGEDDIEKQVEFEEKLNGKKKRLHFIRNGKEYIALKEGDDFFVEKIKTFNGDKTGKPFEFELEEQSDGTRRILDLVPAIHAIENKPFVFVIDEIDRSLHPAMTKELLRHFMRNPSKGQIIFTTHESNLLDLDIFRQDEIWFSEKEKGGATKMYSLSDFKPRYDADIRRGYLAGRFGAIPFLGNLQDLNWNYAQKQGI